MEVISQLDGFVANAVDTILVDPDDCWQPSDFLPDFSDPEVFEEVKMLQKRAEGIPDTVLTSQKPFFCFPLRDSSLVPMERVMPEAFA